MTDKLATNSGSCKEKDCKVLVTGECYEGNQDPNMCPNYTTVKLNSKNIASSAKENPSPDNDDDSEEIDLYPELPDATLSPEIGKDLYSGRELDYASSLRFTRSSLTRVIVLAGIHDTGKTTLLASLYELFQAGPVSNYIFAASDTLPAFDERAHLSRVDSDRDKEDTERSKSSSEQTMLHLCVRDKNMSAPRLNLLISDIWGEFFRDAINSAEDAKKLKLLRRADHVVILIDGAKVASLETRNQATTAAQMMLRSFIEAGMVGSSSLVEILFSKGDLIDNADKFLETDSFLESIREEIQTNYGSMVKSLTFRKIAARPEEGLTSYGLEELLINWIESTPYLVDSNLSNGYKLTSQKPFDLYCTRQLPSKFT